MANLTITPANVKPASVTTRVMTGEIGETIVAGEILYQSSTDGLFYKADADTLAASIVRGMAMTGGVINEIIFIASGGSVEVGAILTVGREYYVSTTAGLICERADVTTGDYLSGVGQGSTTSVMRLAFDPTKILL